MPLAQKKQAKKVGGRVSQRKASAARKVSKQGEEMEDAVRLTENVDSASRQKDNADAASSADYAWQNDLFRRSSPDEQYDLYVFRTINRALDALDPKERKALEDAVLGELRKSHPDVRMEYWEQGRFRQWREMVVRSRLRKRLKIRSIEEWKQEGTLIREGDPLPV